MVRISFSFLLILMICAACSRSSQEIITESEIREHVEFLASDERGGRYIGTEGIKSAEEYIADQFQHFGLSTLPGKDEYYQPFALYSQSFDQDLTAISIQRDNETISGSIGADFRPFSFSSFGEKSAELIFAGYGITAPEYDYDDYDGLHVEGKIVLIMRHEPNERQDGELFDGKRFSGYALFRKKAENAHKHGAIGMLVYTDPVHHAEDDDLRVQPVLSFDAPKNGLSVRGEIDPANGFMAFQISQSLAALVIGVDRQGLTQIQHRIDQEGDTATVSHKLGNIGTASLHQTAEAEIKAVVARNVAAIAVGSDRELRDEWIVVGAHHDHLGSYVGEGDTIFNGADDNASGVSGLLELAEQIATTKLRRSIVFITFTAEEEGLFGSYALDRFNLIDLAKVKFMMNIDMIGRNPEEDIMVYGDGYAPGIRELLEKKNLTYKLSIAYMDKTYEPLSDNAVFHDNRIPYLMFFTGEHQDYHGTRDHAEALSYPRMETLMRFSYDILAIIDPLSCF